MRMHRAYTAPLLACSRAYPTAGTGIPARHSSVPASRPLRLPRATPSKRTKHALRGGLLRAARCFCLAPGLIATSAVGALGYDTGAVFLRNNPVEIRTYGQTTHKYRKPDPRGPCPGQAAVPSRRGGRPVALPRARPGQAPACAGALRLSLLRRRPIDRRAGFCFAKEERRAPARGLRH